MDVHQTFCSTSSPKNGIPRPLRTLLVDDSALLLTCLRRVLDTHALFQVVGTAANGSEALHKANSLAPDLVLMDLHMPGMDGLQATALLRRRLPDARIIIMTLDETAKNKTAARAHGAHGFVGKTQIAKTLMAEIHRVFPLNDTAEERGTA